MNQEETAQPAAHRVKQRPNFWASLIVGLIGVATLLLIFWPIGLLLIIIAAVNDKTWWICSTCGNKIEPTATLCPTCRSHLW